MLHGLMTDQPLLITSIMNHAQRHHPDGEVVSITADNPRHRYRYQECFQRTAQLAHALTELGVAAGDRVATLAWNDYRHLELYFATSCMGAVCHTINPRLFADQLVYIMNHAEDRYVCVAPSFLPLVESVADRLQSVRGWIVLTDRGSMPKTSLDNVLCYDEILAGQPDHFAWPQLDERTASSLCYTSGTTGNPKGVLYSHRSNMLHTFACLAKDSLGAGGSDTILPVVPMFHANAWGQPYVAPAVGAKLVLPGDRMGDGETLHRLIQEEGVTVALGVPTVWLALLHYLEKNNQRVDSLHTVVVGGSACPPHIIETFAERYDVQVIHAWGMTETSPLGTVSRPLRSAEDLSREDRLALRLKQGKAIFGIDMRIVDDEGKPLPWDGETFGRLQVRGPWVAAGYYKLDRSEDFADDGWFDTGDVATIDERGFMQITDRAKDVIKSGGEWISSIALENTAMGHPAVAEAAVIGKPHPKWDERPLLVVVPEDPDAFDPREVLSWFEGKVAKWWIPEDVHVVDELPHTASGKVNKRELRNQLEHVQLASAQS